MTDNERDTHFAGFARLLIDELYNNGPQTIDTFEKIIAQRVYDLASFAVYKSMRGCSLSQIPDITEWSTLTENRKFDV
jgi:hypothetical protein